MNASTNPMAGYTVIKSAGEQMKERGADPPVLEVLDLSTMQKSQVIPKIKRPRKNKQTRETLVVEEQAEDPHEPDEPLLQEMTPITQNQADKEVVFITPYTEVTVNCFEVYSDSTVFSVITPAEDRVKVKPKRGAKLSAVYQGQSYNLYASGIYLPVEALNATVSIFFLVDTDEEEE